MRKAARLTLLVGALLALSLIVSACGSDAAASGPPDIEYGRDVCDECHMIITEARFVSAYRNGGEAQIFDDPGGMIVQGTRSGELEDADVWVHDFHSEEWIDAPSAWYVHGGDLASPMAFRIAAFTEEAAAVEHVGEHGGEVVSWADLVALAESGDLAPLFDEHEDEHEMEAES